MYRGLTLFFGSRRNLGLSILAVALLFLCLVAGNWQYERGVERRIENQVI